MYLWKYLTFPLHFLRNLSLVDIMASTVQLVSNEGESFDISVDNAKMSTLIANLIENAGDDDDEAQEIPLPNVKSSILSSVIEFMNHYASEQMNEIDKVCTPSPCLAASSA